MGSEVISDYAFMTSEKTMCPVLVRHDYGSKGIWALAFGRKGTTATSTKWVAGRLDDARCARTAVNNRADQEESIVALKKVVANDGKAETVFGASPVRD